MERVARVLMEHEPIGTPVTEAKIASPKGASREKRSKRPPIQAKLEVGAVDDPLEREADLVAQRVVATMRAGAVGDDGAGSEGGRIRRSADIDSSTPAADREVSHRIRRSSAAGTPRIIGGGRIQRAATIGADGGSLDDETERSLQQARSGGSALDGNLQRSMGEAMGADLSGVRVHTGSTSDSLNEQLGAKAFTSGNDVFFRGGLPDAGSAAGLGLIAHEVAHTVQQGASPVRRAPDEGAAGASTPAAAESESGEAESEASNAPSPNEVPEDLSGKIAQVEGEPVPEIVAGRLPLQEDTTRRGARSGTPRPASVPVAERSGTVIPIDAQFSTGSRIRRVDGVAADGARDDQGVGRAITYGSKTAGGMTSTAFGSMQPAASFKNIVWEWADGKIQIDATLFGTFDWGVNPGTRTDIADPTSPAVTATNYAEIAADLTPHLEGGSWRPSRRKYWSSALTSRHEMFHATDADTWFKTEGPGIARAYLKRTPIVLNWYERWMPATVKTRVEAALNGAIGEMYKQFGTYMNADMGPDGYLNFPAEIRAFGDGKDPYQALATGVEVQGKKLAAAATPKAPTETPPSTPTPSTPPLVPTGST